MVTTLEFLCPNGHKIRCPQDRAGHAARCPKCGVKFIIPALEEEEPPKSGGSGVRSGPRSSVVSGRDQIEFLCPNGHRLHSARNLQGRPGQCPECNSKFRIPTFDEPVEAEPAGDKADQAPSDHQARPAEPQVSLEPLAGKEDSAVNLLDIRLRDENSGLGSHLTGGKVLTALQADGSGRIPRTRDPHPLAELLARLWAQRGPEATLELRLLDGETFLPEQFLRRASQGSYALFTTTEPEGRSTVVAVAWDAISQVRIRHLAELPEDLRD